ncbi:hypothetical protein GUITHDRAFT_82378 [Guillardia theta CCMP2712]|uniref:Proteasome assembly chaperone 4 n=1 Tax=Guillardia theta (strain CCMP2712) TaxID=905079 RepID=L1I7Y3_GUITC|nr:hypothetical protein GUITHDRAFT_82378 [Guillardia theta CCMP2712]EKX32361.1 hypothetical protein GUITHDRAFT_82378 [Guillardia theta CCMP2712]|eukprot:XP_005819341.1 hypothetical protein GUITHDRAFT_82378 [Guillardia theta CCMP2712]
MTKLELEGEGGAACSIREHTFMEVIEDVKVYYQLLLMKDSIYVWIGASSPSMKNLDMAMPSSLDPLPLSVTLMGEGSESIGSSLARRLSMRLKAQVFVSYNLPSSMPALQGQAEKRLFEELKDTKLQVSSLAIVRH